MERDHCIVIIDHLSYKVGSSKEEFLGLTSFIITVIIRVGDSTSLG